MSEKTPFSYTTKTDDEIKELARAVVSQQVFIGTMIPIEDANRMMPSVFMPLMFIEPDTLKQMDELNVVPYEFMDKAGPRSVNGYPSFMSMQFINHDDYRRLIEKVKAVEAAIEGV